MGSDSSMCPGIDSDSKSEYQDNPGGKGGRCVRLTTYHLHVPIVKKSGGLNLLESCGPLQVCNGTAFIKIQIFCAMGMVTYCQLTSHDVVNVHLYRYIIQSATCFDCTVKQGITLC